jgi:hypothetical protein
MKETARSGGQLQERRTKTTTEARLFKACMSCCAASAELEEVPWFGLTPRHFTREIQHEITETARSRSWPVGENLGNIWNAGGGRERDEPQSDRV